MSIYMTVYKCICMHEYMYVGLCMHVLYAYIRVCIHLCVYTYMYIYIYACVHTCMYICNFPVGILESKSCLESVAAPTPACTLDVMSSCLVRRFLDFRVTSGHTKLTTFLSNCHNILH